MSINGLPDDVPQVQAMSRLTACTTTLRFLIMTLEDPETDQERADLLIACDDVIHQANKLYSIISEMTWGELDVKAHPSSFDA